MANSITRREFWPKFFKLCLGLPPVLLVLTAVGWYFLRGPGSYTYYSREELQQKVSQFEFAYEPGQTIDGQPSVVGKTPDGTCYITIIGWPGDVYQVRLQVLLPFDDSSRFQLGLERIRRFAFTVDHQTYPWVIDSIEDVGKASFLQTADRNVAVEIQHDRIDENTLILFVFYNLG